MGDYFVLPSSTYADPGFSPKDKVSGLVSFNFLESNLNSFCKADSVKFLVFNEGSKSRGISPHVQLSSLHTVLVVFAAVAADVFVRRSIRDLKILIPPADQNSFLERESKSPVSIKDETTDLDKANTGQSTYLLCLLCD